METWLWNQMKRNRRLLSQQSQQKQVCSSSVSCPRGSRESPWPCHQQNFRWGCSVAIAYSRLLFIWESIYNSAKWLQHLEKKKSLFHSFYSPWWPREQIPSILRFTRQIQTLHWLPVVWISGEFHLSGHLLHHNSCWIFFRQQMKNSVYRSRQSLNSPSPGETEMDLLVTRERPRRGIRNSGYDVSLWWAKVNTSSAFPWKQRG